MFTVKHRESPTLGENEYLYSANEVKVVRKGAHFEDGIYLDPEPPVEPSPEEYAEFERQINLAGQGRCDPPQMRPTNFAKTVILFGGDQTAAAEARQGGKVWVMNEAGATVATYDL